MRIKIRKLGIQVGQLPTGKNNCITDVPEVKVGHITYQESLSDGESIHTGVTAIIPHNGNLFREKISAASHVINGFGKTTGLVQVNELGTLEAPIMLTNTFQLGNVWQGTLDYMCQAAPEIGDTASVNIVVGECNDSYLNSARYIRVKPEDAVQAIKQATSLPTEEGGVGAGTGTVCFGYKGGIGTSSRKVDIVEQDYLVGVLVLSNFGKRHEFNYAEKIEEQVGDLPPGSIIIIVATNAPCSDRQLRRMAKRAAIGLARTGSNVDHGSGDIVIAFSNASKYSSDPRQGFSNQKYLNEYSPLMNELFRATAEAVEEAILNSLTNASDTVGRKGRKIVAIPYSILKPM